MYSGPISKTRTFRNVLQDIDPYHMWSSGSHVVSLVTYNVIVLIPKQKTKQLKHGLGLGLKL